MPRPSNVRGQQKVKIFTCTKFTGHYPIGTAAVVIGNSAKAAAALLNKELQAQGLPGNATPEMMEELPYERHSVRILCNGDY